MASVKGNVPIIIVATDKKEQTFFQERMSGYDLTVISAQCYANEKGISINVENSSGVINAKKFLGIMTALDRGAEYIMVFDADSQMLSTTNEAFEAAKKNYVYRFFGTTTNYHSYYRMNDASRALFQPADAALIDAKTVGGRLYTWFFDAPLYYKEDVLEFFAYFGAELWSKLTWHTFDHILYRDFLLARKNAQITNYGNVGGLPEFLDMDELRWMKRNYGYQPIWCSASKWDERSKYHMLYHVDRKET